MVQVLSPDDTARPSGRVPLADHVILSPDTAVIVMSVIALPLLTVCVRLSPESTGVTSAGAGFALTVMVTVLSADFVRLPAVTVAVKTTVYVSGEVFAATLKVLLLKVIPAESVP